MDLGIEVLCFILLLLLSLAISFYFSRHKSKFLTESSGVMLWGILIGAIFRLSGASKGKFMEGNVEEFPEFFFYFLIPPIIFEAGYTFKRKEFFRNMGTILLYAVIGTLLSTFVLGFGLGFLYPQGLGEGHILTCFLFGALISAVDPVATLAILGSNKRADPLVYNLIFGESVLNDAVSIVLFRVLKAYVKADHEFTEWNAIEAFFQFIGISLGSLVIGSTVGLCSALVFKNVRMTNVPKYEISLLALFAYLSYVVAELARTSGIMPHVLPLTTAQSLFFCGVIMSHYSSWSISPEAHSVAEYSFEALAMVSETFIFFYLGAMIFGNEVSDYQWDWVFILFSLLLCFIGRALNTFLLSFFANLGRVKQLTWRQQVFIWFAGLRGAVAFALALNSPKEHKKTIIPATLMIVTVTTLILGGLSSKMLEFLGLDQHEDLERSLVTEHQYDPLQVSESHRERGWIHRHWTHFDERVMKKYFGGRPRQDYDDDQYDNNRRAPSRYSNDFGHDTSQGNDPPSPSPEVADSNDVNDSNAI